jgi:ribosome biogenesis GTPase / thiamine phosphate phosphatase
MGKRRINKQQAKRIKSQHKSLNEKASSESSASYPEQKGLIISRFGSQADVESEEGQITRCHIRQNLGDFVAGDNVIWKQVNDEHGVIVALSPRKSVLGRPDKSGKLKPIAANIDQLMIVVAIKPLFSPLLLDSYLVIAETLHLTPIIILNKSDLNHSNLVNELSLYDTLNYPIIETSSKLKKGLLELRHSLSNQVSVFVGQSGVGKSSLISMLLPSEEIQTGGLSDNVFLGRHTTSMSKLYHLELGGSIIDSPGIREFGLWHMNSQHIANGFIEFRPFLSQCKFRDCNHTYEPGCAILHAVKEGQISNCRYKNYAKLCQSRFN